MFTILISSFSTQSFDSVLKWVNSGQSFKEYREKHGKVVPEKKYELPPEIIAVKQPEIKDVEIKIKPEAYDWRIQVVKEERQKISIDIEINLIVNGKKITL